MRLYYHPLTQGLRVQLVARELDIELELVKVDLSKGEQNTPEFLALNPNHHVPVLQDGDFVLWESYAIMQYLANITPGQTLYPADPKRRADIDRWLFWCGQELMPAIATLNWENHIKPMVGLGEPDPAQVADGEARFNMAASILDALLAREAWISGDALSLADFAIAAPLAWHQPGRLPLAQHTHLMAWFRRIEALPTWQETLKANAAAMA